MNFFPAPVPFPSKVIYREVAIGIDAFDRLKHWQRYLERKEGRRLTNGEVLDRLILAVPVPEVAEAARQRT